MLEMVCKGLPAVLREIRRFEKTGVETDGIRINIVRGEGIEVLKGWPISLDDLEAERDSLQAEPYEAEDDRWVETSLVCTLETGEPFVTIHRGEPIVYVDSHGVPQVRETDFLLWWAGAWSWTGYVEHQPAA